MHAFNCVRCFVRPTSHSQFVPFRDFDNGRNGRLLAKATLREIPDQVVSYMLSRGIVPDDPQFADYTPPTARGPASAAPLQTSSWPTSVSSYGMGENGLPVMPAFHTAVLAGRALIRSVGLPVALLVLFALLAILVSSLL